MNKNTILLLLFFFCTVLSVRAEEVPKPGTDANIYGHVIDRATGEHLPYVTVSLKGTTLATATDATGHYMLKNLPVGKFVIEVKMLGYKTLEQEVTLKSNASFELNFTLDEAQISLDEVVVSANRNVTNRRLAPTLVQVLEPKVFEATQSVTLSQGLNFQSGVRVEDNCQNCGLTQVRINGLDGHYSQILIDSRPVFSALNGVYGLDQIPANMVERVEVMRGGGSALFGSSAIGGTINIITKEPIRNLAQLSHSLLSVGGSNSFDNNTTLNASLITDDHKAGLYLYAQNRYRSGYDRNGDGYTELPELRNRVVGLRAYYRTSAYSRISLQYQSISDLHRGGNMLSYAPHEANICEKAEHQIHGGGISYDLFSPDSRHKLNAYVSLMSTDRDSYYGGIQSGTEEERETALKAYSRTTDLTLVGGAQYTLSMPRLLFMPADLTVGGEYNFDELEDSSIGYNYDNTQRVRIGSGFLQNEWKNERWSLLLGGRMDKHNLIDGLIFSPRVNVRFNPTRNLNLRLSYSGGFRAPQTFDEDLHVTVAGGERIKKRLADGLKEERSHSFSASADWYLTLGKSWSANFLLEGFYTELQDVFSERKLDQPDADGNIIFERYNGSGARVMGLTMEGRVAYASLLQLQVGATLQQSRHKQAEVWSEDAPAEKRMFRTPDLYGYFTATLTPVKRLTATLSGTYTGEMLVQHLSGSGTPVDIAVETPDFFDMNLRLAYDFPMGKSLTLQVNGGVQNIFDSFQSDFDKGYNRDSGYIYGPSQPRSYYAGMKLSF